jgi:DNA polymerase III subunit epsilon
MEMWPFIVQLSYVIYNTETHAIEKIVNNIVRVPDRAIIPPEIEKIHGISKEQSQREGIPIQVVLAEFYKDIADRSVTKVIAHNMSFDLQMIKSAWLRVRDKYPDTVEHHATYHDYMRLFQGEIARDRYVCTKDAMTEFCKIPFPSSRPNGIKTHNSLNTEKYKWPKLEEAHNALFGTTPVNLHNSLFDCLVTVRVYVKFTTQVDPFIKCVQMKRLFHDNGIITERDTKPSLSLLHPDTIPSHGYGFVEGNCSILKEKRD